MLVTVPPAATGVIATGEEQSTNEYLITWVEDGRWVAELRSNGITKTEVLAAADSLYEMDDAAWAAWLAANSGPGGGVG